MKTREELSEAFGWPWFDYQIEAFDGEQQVDSAEMRVCLYFRTGAGKTSTALALLALKGHDEAIVVAPPKTHEQWVTQGALVGIKVEALSHSLYRQKGRKYPRLKPIIMDEFHMLGGHNGAGYDKFRRHSRSLQAPVILLSATPNYNDVERVYCVKHALSPIATQGGYLGWLYQECLTEENPYARTPKVLGFRDGRSAREHLASLPHVYYVEDEHADFPVAELKLQTAVPELFETYGLSYRHRRIMASRMERDSVSRQLQLLDDDELLRPEVYEELSQLVGQSTKPAMVFCARATIARAAHETALKHGARSGLVVFEANKMKAELTLAAFKRGALDVLFGTATMSTGVDGLDKVCDMLILLDDTNDDALRRQVIGRILPRGASTDVSKKVIVRMRLGVEP